MSLLIDHWYIVCRSAQLKSRPLSRTVVNEAVVVFRDANGVAACLADRCAHRNMALSRGRVTDAGLRCKYHGWAWDKDGKCADIPASCADCSTYSALRVQAFPTVEKQGFVWAWFGKGPPMGESMDFPNFEEKGWHHWVMERVFPGHAFHCVENFLDVPHTAHVHRGLFRGAESKEVEIEITSGRDWIQAEFLNEERMESIIGRLLVPKGESIKHTDRFQLPYVTRVDYRMSEKRQYLVMSQCTPVNETETRVFTYMAYRFAPLGRLVRLGFEPLSHLILNQDVKIIREQTEDLERTGDARFLYFETDAIAKGIRRLLDGESLENEESERRKLLI
jgi:phenylpropionate dioxygenase-like ring-hydroxylating dioxygenase large terminal subunit